MSFLFLLQSSGFLLLGALVLEETLFAITRAVDGYEDELGFHWDLSSEASGLLPMPLATF